MEDSLSTKSLLSLVLKQPKYYKSVEPLLPIFKEDYYVLAWYACYFSKERKVLTERTLQAALRRNSKAWLQDNSLLNKGTKAKATKDFIDSKVTPRPSNEIEYARAFESICLNTYLELTKEEETMDEEEAKALLEEMCGVASTQEASDIITTAFTLLSGQQTKLRVGRTVYYEQDALKYIRDRVIDAIDRYEYNTSSETYEDRVRRQLALGIVATNPIFYMNLGNNILPDMTPGLVVTVNAPPKTGKTRFVVGEFVFPAILAGKNVKYLTGEMSAFLIYRALVVKYIYEIYGEKPKDKVVGFIMGFTAAQSLGEDVTKYQAKFDKIDPALVELVKQAMYDLLYSGRYGRLTLIHLADDTSNDKKQFVVDDWDTVTIKEQQELPEDERYDLIVLDHANHMSSEKEEQESSRLRKVYQKGKVIAESNVHRCLVVIINHLTESDQKDAEKSESLNGKKYRAHGTTEDRKSCDLALALIQTTEDERSGEISLVITDCRIASILADFKTTEFKLTADKERCNFCYKGYQKPAYKRVA